MPMTPDATKELLASARHYSGMRFGMMGVFIVLSALLVNVLFSVDKSAEQVGGPHSIAIFGILASIWFFVFECLLSYNLLRLWGKIESEGEATLKDIWPHRSGWAVWVARLVLPAPYLLAAGYWLKLITNQCLPGLFWILPVMVWLSMWIFFFAMAGERGGGGN